MIWHTVAATALAFWAGAAIKGSPATVRESSTGGAVISTGQRGTDFDADIGLIDAFTTADRAIRTVATVGRAATAVGDDATFGAHIFTFPLRAARRYGLARLADAGRQVKEHIGQDLFLIREVAGGAIGGEGRAPGQVELIAVIINGDVERAVDNTATLIACIGMDRGVEAKLHH